jgi:lysophospholipase L1-like esterase
MASLRARRLALASFSLLLGLGACEVVLRIAWRKTKPASEQSWHEYDERLGWRNKKGFKTTVERTPEGPLAVPFVVELNAQGLRDERDMAPEPSAGVFRIACLGDSFTFGYRIAGADAYPKRLEADLGPGYEVWNWGVCAYGLDQFVLLLDEVLASRPRLVVLGAIDMSFRRATNTHFQDGTAKPRFYLEDGALVLTNVPVPIVKEGDVYCRVDVRGSSYVVAGLERAFSNVSIKLSKDPVAATEDWQLGRALLLEAARKCKRAGVELAVALLPESHLIGEDRYERLLPTLEDEGVTVLDLYWPFVAVPKEWRPLLYIPSDGHPSELGARAIALALEEQLRARGLLAPR